MLAPVAIVIPSWVRPLLLVQLALVVPLAWCWRHWRGGVIVTLLGAALTADGSMTTLPLASREASLCAALGAEAPCAYEALAHLRGTLTFAANSDVDGQTLVLLFAARGSTVAQVPYNTSVDETDVLERVQNPNTNWSHLIADQATWPALRALAHVTDGVPVIVAASPRRGAVDHVGDPLASVAMLKVKLAFLRLVE